MHHRAHHSGSVSEGGRRSHERPIPGFVERIDQQKLLGLAFSALGLVAGQLALRQAFGRMNLNIAQLPPAKLDPWKPIARQETAGRYFQRHPALRKGAG